MPYVRGFLNIVGGGRPDNDLPDGERPADPDYGLDSGRPSNPIVLPPQPPMVWPPITIERPIVPVHPDNSLPVQPGTIWPNPGRPNRPGHDLPSGGRPDNDLPRPPGRPDNSLPPGGTVDNDLPSGGQIDNGLPSQTFWMLCYTPSLGWKFIAVDPSLSIGGGPALTPEPR